MVLLLSDLSTAASLLRLHYVSVLQRASVLIQAV